MKASILTKNTLYSEMNPSLLKTSIYRDTGSLSLPSNHWTKNITWQYDFDSRPRDARYTDIRKIPQY